MTHDLVHFHDQQATTTSLIVADKFGKRHRDLLRAIRNMECSKEFNERNFAPVDYVDPKGETRPMYLITRDGFAFLAMGFTGKEAAAWKEKFIAAFNALEAEVLSRLQSDTQWERGHVDQAKNFWFKQRPQWKLIYGLLIHDSLEPKAIAARIGRSVSAVRRAIHRMIEVGILHPALVCEAIRTSAFARRLARSGLMETWGGKVRQLDLFA